MCFKTLIRPKTQYLNFCSDMPTTPCWACYISSPSHYFMFVWLPWQMKASRQRTITRLTARTCLSFHCLAKATWLSFNMCESWNNSPSDQVALPFSGQSSRGRLFSVGKESSKCPCCSFSSIALEWGLLAASEISRLHSSLVAWLQGAWGSSAQPLPLKEGE